MCVIYLIYVYNNNNDNNIIIMMILILVIIIIIIIHACVYLCLLGSPRMVLSCPPETWGRQRALKEHQVLCRDARAQQLGDISNSNTGWGMILNPKDPYDPWNPCVFDHETKGYQGDISNCIKDTWGHLQQGSWQRSRALALQIYADIEVNQLDADSF